MYNLFSVLCNKMYMFVLYWKGNINKLKIWNWRTFHNLLDEYIVKHTQCNAYVQETCEFAQMEGLGKKQDGLLWGESCPVVILYLYDKNI